MELILIAADDGALRAGYACPCGCTPSVEYARGAETVDEGCCCGNHFAIGPDAASSLKPKAGYRPEVQALEAPWGERLEAAWLVGPSVHGPGEEHGHEHVDESDLTASGSQAIDPVCGMTVEPVGASAKGLNSTYQGTEYYFCGKGCKLEFGEDPERYLDPGYVPQM
jgi:YHS domain-containing protein